MKNDTMKETLDFFKTLRDSYKAVEKLEKSIIEKDGLGLSDYLILDKLYRDGEQPINQLGRHVHLSSGSITLAVDRLQDQDLVSRKQSVDDRRVFMAFLTPKGTKTIEKLFDEHNESLATVLKSLSQAQARQTVAGLSTIRDKANSLATAEGKKQKVALR